MKGFTYRRIEFSIKWIGYGTYEVTAVSKKHPFGFTFKTHDSCAYDDCDLDSPEDDSNYCVTEKRSMAAAARRVIYNQFKIYSNN